MTTKESKHTPEKQYQTTKEHCQSTISGVCPGCGGTITPIETVDNANNPTFWSGCLHCNKFTGGIEMRYFEIARKLVVDNEITPISDWAKCDFEQSEERLTYYYDEQTARLSGQVCRIAILLKSPLLPEAIEVAKSVIDWMDNMIDRENLAPGWLEIETNLRDLIAKYEGRTQTT